MASQQSMDYYIGVIPKAPIASKELVELLVTKFRAFRLQALTEADGKAFGRTELSAERQRDIESYREELTDPGNHWFSCFNAQAGLHGNIFRNAEEKPPEVSQILDARLNADDERIIREGEWIGMSSGHGPMPAEEWQLARLQGGQLYPDEVESRFHLANLYFLEGHRGVKANDDEKLFLRLCYSSFDYCYALSHQLAKHKPAYCRLRGTISPDAPGTKLMDLYKSFDYHFIGWVPQVTAMILNKAKVDGWPLVEENPAFYSHCTFPTFEKVCRVNNDGSVHVLTEEGPKGEVWTKAML